MSYKAAYFNFPENFDELAEAPAAGDYLVVYDASAKELKKIDATDFQYLAQEAFSGNFDTNDKMFVRDASDSNKVKTIDAQDIAKNAAFDTSVYANLNLKHHVVTATIAEVNAGHTLIDGVAGKTIYVADITALATGTWTDATSVDVEDSNGTPVSVASFAVAALGDGAIAKANSANVTPGAGLVSGLTAGADLVVTKTGSDEATATSVTFSILYSII